MLTIQPSLNDVAIDSYFRELDDFSLLTSEEEQELAVRIMEGDMDAREEMVKANLRLVIRIAKGFLGRGLGLSDLIQEGNLGLIHAVERFDPAMNTRFSTYAKYWIEESISRSLQRMSGPVHMPAYANQLRIKWNKMADIMRSELGRTPTVEEVGKRLKLSRRQMAIIQKAERIRAGVLPLDTELSENIPESLVQMEQVPPEERLGVLEEMQQVLDCLDQLPARQADVLRMRFGLNGQSPMTLVEIGNRMALTRERVRQLEKQALANLSEKAFPARAAFANQNSC